MEIVGIARDLTLDPYKKNGFNMLAPVIYENGRYYLQTYADELLLNLIDELANIDVDDDNLTEILASFLNPKGKDIHSIAGMHNRKYKLVEYDEKLDDFLLKVDASFHIEPDLEIEPEKLILGISFDDEIYIGRTAYIVNQLELLVGDELTLEEVDILYRIYGVSEQFDKMAEILDKALKMPMSFMELHNWQYRKRHYELELRLDKLIKSYKGKTYTLIGKDE